MKSIQKAFHSLTGSNQIPQDACEHLSLIQEVSPGTDGCEECLQMGDEWVHLRICLTCGHVGCCDNSKNRHATKHYRSTDHPVIKSFEEGEDWMWCYEDRKLYR